MNADLDGLISVTAEAAREIERLRTELAERTRERDANYFAATNAQQSERRIVDILEKVKHDRDERTQERDDARRLCVLAWAQVASPGGVGFDEMCRLIAIKKGWRYLYSE